MMRSNDELIYEWWWTGLLRSGDNCGTGSGGFKPGNECASSEGGSDMEDSGKAPEVPHDMVYSGPTEIRVYRAAADEDLNSDSTAFAEEKDSAVQYLDNPGYGGENLYRTDIKIDPNRALDLTAHDDVAGLADFVGKRNPGAIGIDEYVPTIADDLLKKGIHWVRVPESYPPGSATWIHIGGGADDPELVKIKKPS